MIFGLSVLIFFREKLSSPEVAHYGYVLDGLPSLSDGENNVQDQFEIIKKCQLKPDFIINIRVCIYLYKDKGIINEVVTLKKTFLE